jgi:subtilisin family serine protease
MNRVWIIRLIIVMTSCLAILFGLAQQDYAVAAGDGREKIEATLVDQITADGSADFIIRFTEQADLSAAYAMDWQARGEFVYNTLREAAERSQVNAKATLDAQGLTYETFIAGNELYVFGKQAVATNSAKAMIELETLNQLAAMPEVSSIRATRIYTIDPVVEVKPFENITWAGDYLSSKLESTVYVATNATPDWGITDTKAPQFWTTFSKQGDGIVVANIDTGVQWNHPALIQEFKCGSNPADPLCWKDPSNICGAAGACDNNGHGTHTMGTMVGNDDPSLPYYVGMAPNAKWIACKGCESSSCSDVALNTCADWILAPGGNPANRPNVVNNSWGDTGGNPWYRAKVQAWKAAGIFPAFSAGNSGSGCGTLGSPGDYQESFGSAAHDDLGNIASFSSRGPSDFGDTPYTKPNISAPGVSVLSAKPGNLWTYMSGTSMASPHTAGAVALLWSLNPLLVGKVDMTFMLLQNHADTPPAGNCGAPVDGQGNNTYGYGYLNVLTAGIAASNLKLFYLPVVMRSNQNNTPPISNGDFEQGRVAWTEYSYHKFPLILQHTDLPDPDLPVIPYDGTWAVWLGGWDNEISYIQQQVFVPATKPYLAYWHWIGSQESFCTYDYGEVIVNDVVVEKYYLCGASNTGGWVKKVVNLSAYAGQSVTLKIGAETDSYDNSNLFIDHVTFQSTLTSEGSADIPATGIDATISKTEIFWK